MSLKDLFRPKAVLNKPPTNGIEIGELVSRLEAVEKQLTSLASLPVDWELTQGKFYRLAQRVNRYLKLNLENEEPGSSDSVPSPEGSDEDSKLSVEPSNPPSVLPRLGLPERRSYPASVRSLVAASARRGGRLGRAR